MAKQIEAVRAPSPDDWVLARNSTVGFLRRWAPGRKIFVSYRRADTQAMADLLYARLATQFGASNVFMDRADIEHGQRWRDEVTRQIGARSEERRVGKECRSRWSQDD